MGGQDVFKGALGWDDWIWWTGIGGVGLFFFLMLLCCCVCVQRAKRKGRQEALAAVQARQREQTQREDAQVRYAQAQQARYPAPTQEQQYKFSQQQGGSPAGAPAQFVPAGGPKKNYGPQVMANGYAAPPPQQQYGQQQQPQYGQQQQQQQQQYAKSGQYGHQQPQYGQQQQQYGAQGKQPLYAPQQQEQLPRGYRQQQQNVPPPPYVAPPPAPQQKVVEKPKEYQTYAKPAGQDYQRKTYQKPKPWHTAAATTDAASFSSNHSDEPNRSFHGNDVPFVAVTSPAGRDLELSASKIGTTLRDRIDALREGSVHENHTRISVDPQDVELPPIGAGRRSLVLAGTVLSEQSSSSSSASSRSSNKDAGGGRLLLNKKGTKPSDDQFKTARDMDEYAGSSQSSNATASKPFSMGQFDDAESYTYENSTGTSAAEERTRVGSVEF